MEVDASQNSPLTTRLEYEFIKSLVKSAEKEFGSLDGPGEVGKYVDTAETKVGTVGSLGELLGMGLGSAVAFTKTVGENIDKIIQKRRKLFVVSIIDSESSESFQKTFRQLFIDIGLRVYHSYELQLKNVYLRVGSGGKKREDQRQAIQILATYVGAKCFEYLVESGSKEDLAKCLTFKKKFEKWSSLWKSWTEEKLYFYLPKSTAKNGEVQEKQYISAYKFFRDTIPVFQNASNNSPFKFQVRANDLQSKKTKSHKFCHKLRRPLDFELKEDQEFQFQLIPLESQVQESFEVDNINCISELDSIGTGADEIYEALVHDESFSWNHKLLAEVRDLVAIIYEYKKLSEDTNVKVTEASAGIKENNQIMRQSFKETEAKIDAVGAMLESLSTPDSRKGSTNVFKIRFNVTEPIETFTGREQYLKDLHENIQKNRDVGNLMTVLSQTSVITGLGGIGKTETVRMYIHKYGQNYDHVVWIDAEQHSTAEAQIRKLANHELKISLTDPENNPQELDAILKELYQKLCLNRSFLLLVFDNAESLDNDETHSDGIRRFLPQSLPPSFVKPAILITSRNRDWGQQKVIQLSLWTQDECITFLLNQLKLENTDHNRRLTLELGQLFDRFPLALQSAVAVISQQSKRQKLVGGSEYGIQDLINEYNSGKRDVLTKQPLDAPASSKTTMLVLWNVSLKKICDHDHGHLAIQILNVMAYLSSTLIPTDLIRALFNDQEEGTLADALELLTDYSLVEIFTVKNHLTVHRMIQDVTIEHLRSSTMSNDIQTACQQLNFGDENTVLISLTQKLRQYLASVPKSSHLYDDVVANVIHVANYVSNKLKVSEFLEFTEFVADEIIEIRMKEASLHFEKLIAHSTQTNGLTDKKTEKYRQQLAYILILKGQFQNALKAYEELLEEQETKWGYEDVDTLTTKNNLAMVLHKTGKYNEAMKMYKEVYEMRKNVLGTHHMSTLQTKHNLAMVIRSQGNYDEALKIYSYVLEVREKQLGSIHLDTLNTKYNIALVLSNQGKYDKAKSIFSEVLEIREKELGSFHPDTLATKNNLAMLLNNQGKSDEAMEMCSEVLEIREKILGNSHPDTLTTKNNIALILNNQGKYAEAIQMYSQVLEIREKKLGSIHPDTLETKHNLAMVFKNLGKYDKAMKMYSEVLEIQIKERGPSHPHSLATKNNIALVLNYQGKYDEALQIYLGVLEDREILLGSSHLATLATKNNIALVLVNKGKYDEALEMYSEVLRIREKLCGSSHPMTVKTKHFMAKVLIAQRKYDEAMELTLEVVQLREKSMGSDHPCTLLAKCGVASILQYQGKFQEALQMFSELVEANEKVLGSSHPKTLEAKCSLAGVFDSQGDHEGSMKVYLEVLEANRKILGDSHPSTLVIKNSIAIVLRNQGKFDDARKAYVEVLTARESALGRCHPDTLATKSDLAALYLKMEDYEEAVLTSQEVMLCRVAVLGAEHPDYRSSVELHENSVNLLEIHRIMQTIQIDFDE